MEWLIELIKNNPGNTTGISFVVYLLIRFFPNIETLIKKYKSEEDPTSREWYLKKELKRLKEAELKKPESNKVSEVDNLEKDEDPKVERFLNNLDIVGELAANAIRENHVALVPGLKEQFNLLLDQAFDVPKNKPIPTPPKNPE